MQTGWENYFLNEGSRVPNLNTSFGVGEPTLNNAIVTSSGVPFFTYNNDVRAYGNRTKIAPHIFWMGRFSLQAEYLIQSRQLADANNSGLSVTRGYYINTSYFLTGERYNGDGTGTYTPISPIRPLMPARGMWGPGAWELAAQFSEINLGNGDIQRGFANPLTNATRLDQLMLGVNWWPNKWVRLSFDWVYDKFNTAIPLNGFTPSPNQPASPDRQLQHLLDPRGRLLLINSPGPRRPAQAFPPSTPDRPTPAPRRPIRGILRCEGVLIETTGSRPGNRPRLRRGCRVRSRHRPEGWMP